MQLEVMYVSAGSHVIFLLNIKNLPFLSYLVADNQEQVWNGTTLALDSVEKYLQLLYQTG